MSLAPGGGLDRYAHLDVYVYGTEYKVLLCAHKIDRNRYSGISFLNNSTDKMHALRATFQIARIFQSCTLIAVIGLTANFIAEIVKINAKPPSILIGTITVVCIRS